MFRWKFKSEVIADGVLQKSDPRKFEYLVLDYLKDNFPMQNWKLTKATADGNRDAETMTFDGKNMWAEAKYIGDINSSITSRRYDSTLVSATIAGNVIKIFFVTNSMISRHLTERVSMFSRIINVKKTVFVDRTALEYWLSFRPEIANRYFNKADLSELVSDSCPKVTVNELQIIHDNDSFTSENKSTESAKVLYTCNPSDRIIAIISFKGFENEKIRLYCGNTVIFDDKHSSGTIPIDITDAIAILQKGPSRRIPVIISIEMGSERKELFSSEIEYSEQIFLFPPQIRAFNDINNDIRAGRELIFNLVGQRNSGKSMLLDWLCESQLCHIPIHDSRLSTAYDCKPDVVLVSFRGDLRDIGAICRVLFTLIIDYRCLQDSGEELEAAAKKLDITNSVLSYNTIKALIEEMKSDDFLGMERRLAQSIEFGGSFRIQRVDNKLDRIIYIFKDADRLTGTAKMIFRQMIEAFQPDNGVTIIIESIKSEERNFQKVINLPLMTDTEVMDMLKEKISPVISSAYGEIFPDSSMIRYPIILKKFIEEITGNGLTSTAQLRDYYARSFRMNERCYLSGVDEVDDWTLEMLAVYAIDDGVADADIEETDRDAFRSLLGEGKIKLFEGAYYPQKSMAPEILSKEVNAHRAELLSMLISLYNNSGNDWRYRNAILRYYPEKCSKYWSEQIASVDEAFKYNRFGMVHKLADAVSSASYYLSGKKQDVYKVRFYDAFSEMHLGHNLSAENKFKKIIQEYDKGNFPYDRTYFDTWSELIDIRYWEWKDFDHLEDDIAKYIVRWKEVADTGTDLDRRAFRTVTNRMMVYLLAEDRISDADNWLNRNLALAKEDNDNAHRGYTLMDYAKGTYHINPDKALDYLCEAESIFFAENTKSDNGPEARRLADCRCEKAFIKALLGKGSIEAFIETTKTLYAGEYWMQYYKSRLKLIALYLLNTRHLEASKAYTAAINSSLLNESVRCQYLMDIFGEVLGGRQNLQVSPDRMPLSYAKLYSINRTADKLSLSIYVKDSKVSGFCLDPRLW